jgi:hypothetical protein
MLNWLFKLTSYRNSFGRNGCAAKELPSRTFPTADTISEWDDPSLFVATGCEAAIRYHRDGFQSLNQVERTLCCLYLLESEVNNGGFGQWICCLCPQAAAESPGIVLEIGATQLAALLTDALQHLGDTTRIRSKDEWVEHYLSMPDQVHEQWESLTHEFLKLEDRFLQLAHRYARDHWRDVRV